MLKYLLCEQCSKNGVGGGGGNKVCVWRGVTRCVCGGGLQGVCVEGGNKVCVCGGG